MTRRLKNVSYLLGPIVIVLIAAAKSLPTGAFLVILGYIIILLVYLVTPWRYTTWASTTQDDKEWFKSLVARVHVIIVIFMLLTPSLCFVGSKAFENFPSWLEDRVVLVIDDAAEAKKLEKEMLTIEREENNLKRSEKSYVGVIRKGTTYLFPTRVVMEAAVLSISNMLSPIAGALLLLLGVLIFAMRITEALGERTYKLQRKGGRGG